MFLKRNTNYTDKSYLELQNRQEEALKSVFPDWNEADRGSLESRILQVQSGLGDLHNYFVDHALKELTVEKAKTLRGLFNWQRLAKQDSFSMFFWLPSFISIEVQNASASDIIITQKSLVNTGESDDFNHKYMFLYDQTILAGQTLTLLAYYVARNSDTFITTGERNYEHKLSRDYYFKTFSLVDALGREWTYTQYLTDHDGDERVFTIVPERYDKVLIKFGDGIYGALPEKGLSLSVEYATKNEERAGYVAPNSATSISTYNKTTGDYSYNYDLSVTQEEASTSNIAPAPIQRIKEEIPKVIGLATGLVTTDDMQSFCTLVSPNYISRTYLWTKAEAGEAFDGTGIACLLRHDYVGSEDEVDPTESGLPTNTSLITLVKTALYPKAKLIGFTESTLDVQVVNMLDIEVTAYVEFNTIAGMTKQAQTNQVLADLIEYFRPSDAEDLTKNPTSKFGYEYKEVSTNTGEIPLSYFYNIVNDSQHVNKISVIDSHFLINGKHDDLDISFQQYPRPIKITLVDIDTLATYQSTFTAPLVEA